MKRLLYFILGAFLVLPFSASALSTYLTVQGGTGTSSPSGILYGDNGATNHLNTVTIGSNLTFSGGTLSATVGSGTVSTSTNEVSGYLPYWTSTSATPALLGKVATTTLGFSGPFNGFASIGTLVGGSNTTITWTGLATTSQPASSNLLTSNGGAGVYGTATSSASCSGTVSCSAFTVVGGVSPTITGSGLSSYDAFTHSSVWGQTTSATSTLLALTGSPYSLVASSTAVFDNASTTQLTVNGDSYFTAGTLTMSGGALIAGGNDPISSNNIEGTLSNTGLYLGGSPGAIYPYIQLQDGTLGGDTNIFLIASTSAGQVSLGTNVHRTNLSFSGLSANRTVNLPDLTGSFALGSYYTGFLNGYIPFGSSGLLATSTNLLWDNSNSRLGVASSTPTYRFSVNDTGSDFYINSSGEVVARDTTNGWSGRLSPTHSFVLGTATTTGWTASTTGSAYSPFLAMPFAGTLKQVRCILDASFLGVNVQVNGSNATPSYFVASTTVGVEHFTAGNTFTAGQKIAVNFGTTTTATTAAANCTFDVTETP